MNQADDAVPAPLGDNPDLSRVLDELQARSELKEQPFASQTPIVGRLVARFREAWNSISTKWYVRPVMHQQSQFNGLLLEALRRQQRQFVELHQIINELDSRLIEADLDETVTVRTAAELSARIIQLERSLAELQARLASGKDASL